MWVRSEANSNPDEFPDSRKLIDNVPYLREYVREIFRDEDLNDDGYIGLDEFTSSYEDMEEYMLEDVTVSTKYKHMDDDGFGNDRREEL